MLVLVPIALQNVLGPLPGFSGRLGHQNIPSDAPLVTVSSLASAGRAFFHHVPMASQVIGGQD